MLAERRCQGGTHDPSFYVRQTYPENKNNWLTVANGGFEGAEV
jgi:hypothetical protein